jgi:hypothetical protein
LFRNRPSQIKNTTNTARRQAFWLYKSQVNMGITKEGKDRSALAGYQARKNPNPIGVARFL